MRNRPLVFTGVVVFASCALLVRLGAAATSKGDSELQTQIDGSRDGMTVEIPKGTYSITAPIRIAKRNGLTLDFAQGAEVVSSDPLNYVLVATQSQNITIRGGIFRHANPPSDSCSGHVLEFDRCSSLLVDSANINGCGAIGIMLDGCVDVTINNCWIHKNWSRAMCIYRCERVSVLGCKIEENGHLFLMQDNKNVVFRGNTITQTNTDFEINNLRTVR